MEFTDEQKERFWAKVNKTDNCWLWTRYCDNVGYGHYTINNKTYKVHRLSWLLAGNIIPEDHVIRHKCKSKNCVNTEHLETGTHAENTADRIRDGTTNLGKKWTQRKLTPEEIQAKQIKKNNKAEKDIINIFTKRRFEGKS